MPDILQLSTSVINKIAAGEVIERPASVVKELVENSLDAGATRIDVVVEKGGGELLRITDNGCGIAADQLMLAVASHATSKIANADDLFHVKTLGFRGEALASIAAVSRMSLRSRPVDCEAGAELEIVGGQAEPIRPVGCPAGTLLEVRQLFFNTPVRQKFLRKPQTELGHITEAVIRLALGNPQTHFTLTHGKRLVHDLPPVEDLRHRVASLFGDQLAENLIEIDNPCEGIRLHGYVANPTHSRSNNRQQYLFLNGRHIRDRALQHALGEAYRGLLLTGRYPICFLNLEMPHAQVDVNVHPSKQEVRFQDGGAIYSQLLGTLRSKFLSTDLVARGDVQSLTARGNEDEIAQSTPQTSELFQWAKQELGNTSSTESSTPPFMAFDTRAVGVREGQQYASSPPTIAEEATDLASEAKGTDFLRVDPTSSPVGTAHFSPSALQIHNRYIVVENDEGLEIIDQHALHERILYEQLRDKVLAGELERQRLLVPEPVDLADSEAAAVLENREILARVGLEVEPFGGRAVLVSAYPAMLAHRSPAEVLRSLVEQLLTEGKNPGPRDVLDELMHGMACKAAVKYGDRLTLEEVASLLAQRHLAQDHHHCPHGRPTTLVFTRDQLDRQFKRI